MPQTEARFVLRGRSQVEPRPPTRFHDRGSMERCCGSSICRLSRSVVRHSVQPSRSLFAGFPNKRYSCGSGLDSGNCREAQCITRRTIVKLFVDTADVKELETCLERGFPSGVTTNPMLIARSNCADFGEHIRSMIDALIKHDAKIP